MTKNEKTLWHYTELSDKLPPPPDLRKDFLNWQFPKVYPGEMTKYNWVIFGYNEKDPDRLALGYRCDIGAFTVIYAHAGVTIGPYVQIGPHCAIMSLSTIDNKEGQVRLERNSRVGAFSTIMPGVTVGENAIVGAYSFVNKDIPSDVVAWGIPVKIESKIKEMNR